MKVVASLWSLPRTVAAVVVVAVAVVAVDIAMITTADMAVAILGVSHSISFLISYLDANLKLGAWR